MEQVICRAFPLFSGFSSNSQNDGDRSISDLDRDRPVSHAVTVSRENLCKVLHPREIVLRG